MCTIDVIVSVCRKTVCKLKASKNKQLIDLGTFCHASPAHELINELLSSEVSLCLYKSAILPCMEYCCHFWAGAPSWYLKLLVELHKQICRTVGPSPAVSLKPLSHENISRLGLFYRYYYGRCSSELAQVVPLSCSLGRPTIILIDWIIFLSPFLDVTGIYILTISILALDSGILRLWMLSFDVWFEWL